MKKVPRPLQIVTYSVAFALFFSLSIGHAVMNPLESVVHFSPACTKTYLGSPSIIRTPKGDLLVSIDLFGPGAPLTPDKKEKYGLIFRSSDEGKTWRFVAEIPGCHWANLFIHRGAIYLLGCSTEYGSIVIRKSEDDGNTWTQPVDSKSGLLFPAGTGENDPKYHCAPMPVVEYKGRLYRAFENNSKRQWPQGFQAAVISADANDDLLDALSWTMSEQLVYDQESDPPEYAKGAENLPGGNAAGWLEGNMVLGSDGYLYDILRVNSLPVVDRAAMARVSEDGKRLSFDPHAGFIEFPGGMTKFAIRFDSDTNRYWTLANNNTNPQNPRQRNVLSIYSSTDLRHWLHHETLLEDRDDFANVGNDSKVGFQYVDFQFDGSDIIFLSRTAFNGAHNYHDANYMTFHRIPDFRKRYEIQPQEIVWKQPLRGATVNLRLNKDDLSNLKQNWGADSTRLMLMYGDIRAKEPPYAIQDTQLQKIDHFLRWCEELGLRCVIDVHETPGRVEWAGEKDRRLWEDYKFHDFLNETWDVLAKRYADRGDVIAGYDLFNEPNMDKQIENTPSDWNALAKRLTETIRQYDKQHVIIVESTGWASAAGFEQLKPTGDSKTVYSFHFYEPFQFTHQNVYDPADPVSYPGEIAGTYWDKKALEARMRPVVEFQEKTGCQIYVGEFSVIRWAPGESGVKYLRDILSLFETNGWSWAYHAYREWPGWGLEYEGPKDHTAGPLETTPRLELLKSFWRIDPQF